MVDPSIVRPLRVLYSGRSFASKKPYLRDKKFQETSAALYIPSYCLCCFGLPPNGCGEVNWRSPNDASSSKPSQVTPSLQVPSLYYRALKTDLLPYHDLPNASCLNTSSCPATILVTGNSPYVGQRLAGKFVTNSKMLDPSNINLANYLLGSGPGLGGSYVSAYAVVLSACWLCTGP